MNEPEMQPAGTGMEHPILLYDGVCGLCNRMVQFILRRDRDGIFRFASLQRALASRVLTRHGASAADLDTVYVVVPVDPTKASLSGEGRQAEVLLARSDAVLFVLRRLGGVWRFGALLLQLLPRALRDSGYRLIATNRYRIFGRYDTCLMPTEASRARFLDV